MSRENKEIYNVTLNQKVIMLADAAMPWDKALRSANTLGIHSWMPENCNPDALEYAWNIVLKYNDSIRLRFFGALPKKQYFADYEYETLQRIHVSGEEEMNALIEKEAGRCFHLNEDPAYRVVIVEGKGTAGGIIILMHHILTDGYSQALMLEQFENAYKAFINGEEYVPDCGSYVDYLKYEEKYIKSKEFKKTKQWWIKKCAEHKELYVPCGYKALKSEALREDFEIKGESYKKLMSFCNENSLTVPSVVMSVIAVTAARLTGKYDIPIFNLSHGRTSFKLKKTTGLMTHALPVMFSVDLKKTFTQSAKDDGMNYLITLSNGHIPFFYYIFYSFWQSVRNFMNFYHSWIIVSPMSISKFEECSMLNLKCERQHSLNSIFYLGVQDVPDSGILKMELDYQKYKFSNDKVLYLISEFNKTLEAVLNNEDVPMKDLF